MAHSTTQRLSSQGLTRAPNADGNGWILQAPGALERVEAFFRGTAFEPHRHDTYAIGLTLAGVQSFDYRGAARHSLPGSAVVLHPDEVHDGRAGDDLGFRYRVLYLEPSLVQEILHGRPLPYVPGGTSHDPRLLSAIDRLLGDLGQPLEPFAVDDALYELVLALDAADGAVRRPERTADYSSAERARQYLAEHVDQQVALADLEQVAGRDRWCLSRDFRTLFGTSPYRYLVMRRLERARRLLRRGGAPCDVALACGFSDQSHMTRQFRKAFGITPRRWLDTLRRAA